MNIHGADSIVEEYLIHRGFTKTFRCLQKEISEDRTKGFNATRIVEQIFFYIYTFDIESFINIWDFLSKRFFMHLDQGHIVLLSNVKSDLIKFYLVNAIKKSHKEKVAEFFAKYSHEIITECGDSVSALRSWYVLPYMEEPEKDPEFSVYFTVKWADMLKVTLNNFLSSILLNASPPKLLLLERWFRSDSQQEMRMQMTKAAENVDRLLAKQKRYEDRLSTMRVAIRDLVSHVHGHHAHFEPGVAIGGGAAGRTWRSNSTVGLFETDEEAERKRERVKELGQVVCRLAAEAVQQGNASSKVTDGQDAGGVRTRQQYQHGVGKSVGRQQMSRSDADEDAEVQLITQVKQWLKLMEC